MRTQLCSRVEVAVLPFWLALAACSCNPAGIANPGASTDGNTQTPTQTDSSGTGGSGGTTGTGGTGEAGASGGQPVAPPTLLAADVKTLAEQKLNVPDPAVPAWNAQPTFNALMIDYGKRFATMPFAAQAQDWGGALNDHEELEYMALQAATIAPEHAAALQDFVTTYVEPLAIDLRNRDLTSFNAKLPGVITACNNCHAANGRAFLVVQPSPSNPRESLEFGPSDPIAPFVIPPYQRPTPPFADTDLLGWADLNTMLNFYLNTPDMTLLFWKPQRDAGPVMLEYGMRFAVMKLAVDAGDWALAQYQYDKAIEAQENDEVIDPSLKQPYKGFEGQYLTDVKYSLDTQDSAGFSTSYTTALTGCNACHVSTGNYFLRVGMPNQQPQPGLAFAASAARAPVTPSTSATPQWPAQPPSLQDATNLLASRMTTRDASVSFWKTQRSVGSFMWDVGFELSVAWFAGQAGNWPAADYHLQRVQALYVSSKAVGSQYAAALDASANGELQALRAAAAAGNTPQFVSAFQQAVTGCNDCHVATGRDFIRVQVPTRTPAPHLKQ
jgi:cytochrome c553